MNMQLIIETIFLLINIWTVFLYFLSTLFFVCSLLLKPFQTDGNIGCLHFSLTTTNIEMNMFTQVVCHSFAHICIDQFLHWNCFEMTRVMYICKFNRYYHITLHIFHLSILLNVLKFQTLKYFCSSHKLKNALRLL